MLGYIYNSMRSQNMLINLLPAMCENYRPSSVSHKTAGTIEVPGINIREDASLVGSVEIRAASLFVSPSKTDVM